MSTPNISLTVIPDRSLSDISTQKLAVFAPLQQAQSEPLCIWHIVICGCIVVLSAFLNFFQIQQNGYGNTYYATAVKSMLLNWHNFFFVSFDPGGFISVDKPPVDLWLQTLSAKLFGFSGFSLFLPQALAGVLAVMVIFYLIYRSHGPVAGLLSAFATAIAPIEVVLSRDNNLDMMLVLVLLLATWAVIYATETGRIRWLLLGAILIGVGFNIKMLEAYLVVPALGLLYLLSAPRKWWLRIIHLVLALAMLLLVSFAWIAVVDLTPPSQRPYVGSSQTNSEFELVMGYNGLERLFHFTSNGKGQTEPSLHLQSSMHLSLLSTFTAGFQNDTRVSSDINEEPGNGNNSSPGLLRLLTQPISGQIAWLFPLALLGMFALIRRRSWRGPLDNEQRALLLWGTWLITVFTALSIAAHFLTYYTVMLVPAISALAGIGLTILWRDYKHCTRKNWRGWMLPLTLLITGVFQMTLLATYPGWSALLAPFILTLTLLMGASLVIARFMVSSHRLWSRISRVALICAILTIATAPFLWSAVSLTYPNSGSSPLAGPNVSSLQAFLAKNEFSHPFGEYTLSANQEKLLGYLFTHRGNTRFLVGTLDTSAAIPLILVTGQPVMALGGFNGSDPTLTISQLAEDAGNGTIRFFLLPFKVKAVGGSSHQTEKFIPTGGNRALVSWITTYCTSVPAHDWESGHMVSVQGKKATFVPSGNLQHTDNGVMTNLLYDCGMHL